MPAMDALEMGHECRQSIHALERHGVVQAGAYATDGGMSRQMMKAITFGFGEVRRSRLKLAVFSLVMRRAFCLQRPLLAGCVVRWHLLPNE
ncbi:hypothetical protein [Pseudomonas stutzeri]|uniref:hypothetical protein n=1 Tax=Stutzerimonas stutzeri TaxID=316 RepID=UPI001C2E1C55